MSVSSAPNSDLLKTKTIKTDNDRKRKNNDTMEGANKHLKSNYYSILNLDDDFQCDEAELQKIQNHVQGYNNKTRETRNDNLERENKSPNDALTAPSTSNNSSHNATSENSKTNNQNKKQKVPPIHIFDINSAELIKFVRDCLKISDFKIKEFKNKNKNTLILNTIENYMRVKIHLEKTKTKFFTYTPKCAKTKTFLLKGLPADTDPEEIMNELLYFKTENLNFIKVNNFETTKSKKEGYKLPIFLVQISSESHIKSLKAIDVILYRCVKWETLKREEIPQCRKCQGFFHSASNCFMESKCVKCGKPHEVGKCELPNVDNNEREKLFCALCNKYGHPASYKGCEKYKELQRRIKAKRLDISHNQPQTFLHTNSNLSYANIVKANNNINVNNTNNSLNSNSFTDVLNSIQNLSNQILNFQKQLQMQASRIDALYSLLQA